MILGNETPEAAVGRTVAVVTHHPVVVHLKGISVCRFPVNVYFSILDL